MRHIILLSFGLMIFSISFSQTNFTTAKCKSTTNDRSRKSCIINEIQRFVDSNYNSIAVKSFAKIGVNRIYARFKIDQIGQISDIQVKATALELEEEAIRALQLFPKLIPVTQKKKSDITSENTTENFYTLPITFEIRATDINLSQKRTTNNN